MKLAFVIPLKPKCNSKDWPLDSYYLRQTINAMIQQTCNQFHIYVVLHDMPEQPIVHHQLTYLTLPSSYHNFSEITDGEHQLQSNSFYKERDVEYQFDQGRKQMFGAHTALHSGCDYVMCVDGDDIVCKYLTEFVLSNHLPDSPGWFVNKGYFYLSSNNCYVRQPYSMNMLNGSTYIIHKDFIPAFDLLDARLGACNFFSNHPGLEGFIKMLFQKPLRPLPFYATIVQVTNVNWWKTTSKITGVTIRQRIKYFVRLVFFKRRLEQSFAVIPTVAEPGL